MHDWITSTLGHGETMCRRCRITNREAAALGVMNVCDVPLERDGAIYAAVSEKLQLKEFEAMRSENARLRTRLTTVRRALLQICDGSNWPEHAQSGDGYKAYGEITEQLHEIAADMGEA